MSISQVQAPSLRRSLAALIDGPREKWKHFVNVLRGVRDVSPVEAQALIEQGAFVLDVREQSEFDAGHLNHSTLIPVGSLPQRIAELQHVREKRVVVICHGGKRSATACWILARHGFGQTCNVAGGILAWKRENLPLADLPQPAGH